MTKSDQEDVEKITRNILHEYHKVIDLQTGKIDKTDWQVCKCQYCSIWTPEVLKAYEEFLIEEANLVA